MEEMSLSDLVQRMGQAPVARALGVKPASIAKALRTHRNIIVTISDGGECSAQETRPFPCQEHGASSDGFKSGHEKALGQPKFGEQP